MSGVVATAATAPAAGVEVAEDRVRRLVSCMLEVVFLADFAVAALVVENSQRMSVAVTGSEPRR